MLDKAVKEHFNALRYPKPDIRALEKHFRRKGQFMCFYCGQKEASRWDHLYPVNKGGATTNGNLVPACSSCNDSKQNRTLKEWYDRAGKRRKLRKLTVIERAVARYRARFPYKPRRLPQDLQGEDRRTYEEFARRLTRLRHFLYQKEVTKKKPD